MIAETKIYELIGLCKLSHNFFSFYSLFILILNKIRFVYLPIIRSID